MTAGQVFFLAKCEAAQLIYIHLHLCAHVEVHAAHGCVDRGSVVGGGVTPARLRTRGV